MGCGSSVAQVAQIGRQSGFRPIRLLQLSQVQSSVGQGRIFLFGQTRTQRKILQCDVKANSIKNITTRTRIPFPKIHLDPLQALYEQTQQIFHLGIYGLTQQPPFNDMLTLFLQNNLLFTCGGRDYDNYNVKNDAYFYSIVDEPFKISTQMIHSSQLSERSLYKPKYANNKFEKMAGMHRCRHSHTGMYCSKIKSIIVFGGANEKGIVMNSCEMYSLLENVWKEIPPMRVPRANAHCFQYGNKVYVFGGRSSKNKLSKKIQIFNLETSQWDTSNFKLHRGIEKALVFSQKPNEIMIIGGMTYATCAKTVIKVNLKEQSYIWDSELLNEYKAPKGVASNHEIFIFGAENNTSETYFHRNWKKNILDHKKVIQVEEIQRFSFSQDSLIVKSTDVESKPWTSSDQQVVFFGTDQYPCLIFYNKVSGAIRKESVPIGLRLKSFMGITEYENGRFMLLGGSDSQKNKTSRACFLYDKHSNTVEQALKMSLKRINFGCVLNGRYIYIFGGYNCEERRTLHNAERYSLVDDKWEDLTSMPKSHMSVHAELVCKDKIALVNGKKAGPMGDIEIYYCKSNDYQVFRPKMDIPNEISLVYNKQEDNMLYILRTDEHNQYFEVKISLAPQNACRQSQLPPINLNQLQTVVVSSKKISYDTQNIIRFDSANKNTVQREQQLLFQEQSSEAHKIEPESVSCKPQLIQIKNKKKYIEKDTDYIGEQSLQQNFQEVKFEENLIEEIRKSGKHLIQQLIKQKANQLDSHVKTSSVKMKDSSHRLHRQKEKIEEPLKDSSLDNQKKSDHPEGSLVQRPPDMGRHLKWLKDTRYNIIKRGNETFFLGEDHIIAQGYQLGQERYTQYKMDIQEVNLKSLF